MKSRDLENTLAIFKREFLSYFNSPVLYVIVVIFLLVSMSFTFIFGQLLMSDNASLAQPFFIWHPWIYMVLAPAVGMRLWSEEHRLGTFELLMTMPISPWQAIVGKFVAAALVWLIALALTFPVVVTVYWLGTPDSGPIITGYAASYLYALGCLAVTSAVSAYTRSQVVCFIVSVTVCAGLTLIGNPGIVETVVRTLPSSLEFIVRFISYLSFMDHFYEMTKGIFVFRDVLYFLSVIVVALVVTHMGLRSKRA
ncbi:ABC-2 type transport system permease protein [Prosthecobacter fusiformis]|uniref:ABC-2 type transport system permease protein n=1 Tax=Prosthecobacter fusiformis TaxID=48464 RepID=A0A4R7S6V4_9BACT|nr:ABC transporter permease subunit [Prosthecobacter fusiformis]TDU72937.1 ABC-2 type transport system permease protein [Prosthecobacter fusiformis]